MFHSISGGDDLTIHEINEAARIITDSIDKDAKVIFGTSKDDKLKKGEMKITVIATGFPTDAPKKSLFASQTSQAPVINTQQTTISSIFSKKSDEKEKEETVVEKKEIHNSIPNDYIKKTDKKIFGEEIIVDDEDVDDEWNAIPAFLRRQKK